MAHKVATVEIEFWHEDPLDGDAILRVFLENMMITMRDHRFVHDPHYHLLPVRVKIIDGDTPER